MLLTSDNVDKIFRECLFKKDEDMTNNIHVEGVQLNVLFNPDRIKKNQANISSMINQLNPTFREGWTFLNMCDTKDGNQWTDLQVRMDQLLTLGLAINKIEYLMPREFWQALPGGVPYITIKGND